MLIPNYLKIEPAGRPNLQCTKCRMTVVWPDGLTEKDKAEFASVVRDDPLNGLRVAETKFQFGAREAKVLVLHITHTRGECHKCGRSVTLGESVCSCRSVNLDW